MPLRDHFRTESERPHWSAIHGGWMTMIALRLNGLVLGSGYLAEASAHLDGGLEIDVGTFDALAGHGPVHNGRAAVGTAVAVWTAPEADRTVVLAVPDEFSVRVFDAARNLVAAVEVVSPGNKDRGSKRGAFIAKCAGYLEAGIGLVMVDLVTTRRASMHGELLELLGEEPGPFVTDHHLYATAYRPRPETEGPESQALADLWERPLEIGSPLPTMPLPLRGGPTVPLELEETYEQICAGYRL